MELSGSLDIRSTERKYTEVTLKDFKGGVTAIQRDDLEKITKELSRENRGAGVKLNEILDRFDDLDEDKNGVDLDELENAARLFGLSELTASTNVRSLSKRSITEDDLEALKTKLEKDGRSSPPGLTSLIQKFKDADTDHDGKLNFDEFSDWAKEKGFQKERVTKDIFQPATTDYLSLLAENAKRKDEIEGSKETLKKQLLLKYKEEGIEAPTDLDALISRLV